MAETSLQSKEVFESSGYTQIPVVHFKYTWTIRNFSLCSHKTGRALKSPTFPIGDIDDGLKWNLAVYPKGSVDDCREYVSVFLEIDPKSIQGQDVQVKVKFCLLNGRSEDINIREIQHHRFEKVLHDNVGYDWGFKLFIRQDFLFSEENNALPDDALTVRCEITAESDQLLQIATPKLSLPKDLKLLFEDPEFSDMTVSVKGRDYQVHKAILSARSSVFKAMFHANMKEIQEQRVEIEDLDEEVVEEMLRFLYTGRVSNLEETAEDLLVASDKYALTRLKRMCEIKLIKNLKITNAAYIFTLADLHSADQLKIRTKKFIQSHIIDVGRTEGWKTMVLTYPRLAIDVFST